MLLADIADTTGQHDRLVVTAQLAAVAGRLFLLVGAEIPAQIGAAEFVIEGSSADRPFQHDIQCRGDA